MEIFGQLSEKFEASCLQSQHAADLRKENCIVSVCLPSEFSLVQRTKECASCPFAFSLCMKVTEIVFSLVSAFCPCALED